jgi:uncharacterized Zn finger protein (UPF0148 family)
MASRLVRGEDGKVVCPWCGVATEYWLEHDEDGFLQVMAQPACEHLDDAEWEAMKDGRVEVVAYNPDADE